MQLIGEMFLNDSQKVGRYIVNYQCIFQCYIRYFRNENGSGQCIIFYNSAVKLLLEAGADPNLQDEYSTINQVAREKQIHPIHGKYRTSVCVVQGEKLDC